MLHCLIIFSTFCGVSFYVAHVRPAIYLRSQDAIAWGIHALCLGLLFGMGIIFGRYGFLNDASGAVADWLMVYAPTVACLYIAALVYHDFLCATAAHRQRGSQHTLMDLMPAFGMLRVRLAISALKRSPNS